MAPGTASLHVTHSAQRSHVLSSRSRSPLKLLTPRHRGESVWAYTSTFGGGMVAGDETALHLKLDPGARCFLSTQSSTKIYRNPQERSCSHRFEADLASESLLILAPDPVQCFADSTYEQVQTFSLAANGNLVLIDWLSSGRAARGERWAFRRYASKNRIARTGQLVLHDSLLLENDSAPLANRFRTGRFDSVATVVLLGPKVAPFASETLAQIDSLSVTRSPDLIISASPLHEGALIRLAGTSVEQTSRAIRTYLHFIPKLLDGDPWSRKW